MFDKLRGAWGKWRELLGPSADSVVVVEVALDDARRSRCPPLRVLTYEEPRGSAPRSARIASMTTTVSGDATSGVAVTPITACEQRESAPTRFADSNGG